VRWSVGDWGDRNSSARGAHQGLASPRLTPQPYSTRGPRREGKPVHGPHLDSRLTKLTTLFSDAQNNLQADPSTKLKFNLFCGASTGPEVEDRWAK